MDKYDWQKRDRERKEAKVAEKKKEKRNKPAYKIKRRAKKLASAERIYSVLSKDFLMDNPVCQCGREGCWGVATEVHHKKGRGKWLNVVEFFLSVCHHCHRWVELNPVEAKRLGYSVSRIW